MARKDPPEHTRFKKGQSGNPGGIPKYRQELLHVDILSNKELQKVISKCMRSKMPDLIAMTASETVPALDIIIAKTLLNAVEKGEYSRIHPLIERVCGKPPEAPPEKDEDSPQTQHLDGLSDEQLLAIAKPA